MKKAYLIARAKARQKMQLQMALLAMAVIAGGVSVMDLARYWLLLAGSAAVAALAARNIRCWLRVFAQNASRDPLEVRH